MCSSAGHEQMSDSVKYKHQLRRYKGRNQSTVWNKIKQQMKKVLRIRQESYITQRHRLKPYSVQ